MLRADGKRLTVNQRVVPLFEPGPGSRRCRATSCRSSMTDRGSPRRGALRETEARFRQFAENIDQLLFIMTGDFSGVLYVNPRYQALLGAPVEELIENPRSALRHVVGRIHRACCACCRGWSRACAPAAFRVPRAHQSPSRACD